MPIKARGVPRPDLIGDEIRNISVLEAPWLYNHPRTRKVIATLADWFMPGPGENLPGVPGMALASKLPAKWATRVKDPRDLHVGFIGPQGEYIQIAGPYVHEDVLGRIVVPKYNPMQKGLQAQRTGKPLAPEHYFPSRMAQEKLLQVRDYGPRYVKGPPEVMSVAAYARMTPEQQMALSRWLRRGESANAAELSYWLNAMPGARVSEQQWQAGVGMADFLRKVGGE